MTKHSIKRFIACAVLLLALGIVFGMAGCSKKAVKSASLDAIAAGDEAASSEGVVEVRDRPVASRGTSDDTGEDGKVDTGEIQTDEASSEAAASGGTVEVRDWVAESRDIAVRDEVAESGDTEEFDDVLIEIDERVPAKGLAFARGTVEVRDEVAESGDTEEFDDVLIEIDERVPAKGLAFARGTVEVRDEVTESGAKADELDRIVFDIAESVPVEMEDASLEMEVLGSVTESEVLSSVTESGDTGKVDESVFEVVESAPVETEGASPEMEVLGSVTESGAQEVLGEIGKLGFEIQELAPIEKVAPPDELALGAEATASGLAEATDARALSSGKGEMLVIASRFKDEGVSPLGEGDLSVGEEVVPESPTFLAPTEGANLLPLHPASAQEEEVAQESPILSLREPIEEAQLQLLPLPQWPTSQAPLAAYSEEKNLTDIYFDFNRWAIPEEMQNRLIDHGQWLKANLGSDVLIEGHCDARGSREYNMVLGEKRAHSVKNFLVALGVENRIDIISYGKEALTCFIDNELCHQENRRAHFGSIKVAR